MTTHIRPGFSIGLATDRRAEPLIRLALCAAVAIGWAAEQLVPNPGIWVFGLFYGSWLLWAIAACAATRSYQLRTSGAQEPLSVARGGSAAESSAGSAV